MDFSYYPGCSLHATGVEYDLSTRAVFGALGVKLWELDGWVCCGASSAHSASAALALNLPAINLALAQQAAHGDLLAPCAACYNRTKAADYALRQSLDRGEGRQSLDPSPLVEYPVPCRASSTGHLRGRRSGEGRHEPARRNIIPSAYHPERRSPERSEGVRESIEVAVGFRYTGAVRVRNPLEALLGEVGLPAVEAQVRRPLRGLKVVSYYGCLLVRPPRQMEFDDPEHPQAMNHILRALGAEVREWSYAVDCCGGSASLPRADVATRLVSGLALHAREAGAAAIVTACPLCQMNLEMRQASRPALPIFYFTELMGLAFGLPEARKWWGKHLIEPIGALRGAGLW